MKYKSMDIAKPPALGGGSLRVKADSHDMKSFSAA